MSGEASTVSSTERLRTNGDEMSLSALGVAAAVAGFRQRYEEHFAQVASEFPRPMNAAEKVMRGQLRLIFLIDGHEAAGHLSAGHANEARLRVLAGDLSGGELDDNPATREWVAEQERHREIGVRLFAKSSRSQGAPPGLARRATATIRTRPRERRATTHRRGSRASPGRQDDGTDLPLAAWWCAGCGVAFERTSPRQHYHSTACSNRSRQRRFKARDRRAAGIFEPDDQDAARVLPCYRDLGVAAVEAGADPLDVLDALTASRDGRSALTAEDAQAARAHLGVESAEVAYILAKPRKRIGRLFEISGYRSRPMNGRREFHDSTLWREVILPSEVDVDRARRRIGGGIDRLMWQAA
jgi:hypothetical protein